MKNQNFNVQKILCTKNHCMQDTFARATHSAYAASRPSTARDDRVSCIQEKSSNFQKVVFDLFACLMMV